MKDIPHRRREQAYKAFRFGLALLVIISLPIGIAAAQTAQEPQICQDGPPIRGDSGAASGDLEVVMVNDISNSIGTSGFESLKDGNAQFISNLQEPDEVGAVSFSYDARIDNNLTTDYAAVNNSIQSYSLESTGDPLTPVGDTRGGPAISSGNDVLLNRTNATDSGTKVMILFTDGVFADQAQAEAAADFARYNSITIFVIGLGSNVNDQDLINIAGDESRYYRADDANLTSIYTNLSQDVREINDQLKVETRDLYLPGETHPFTVRELQFDSEGNIIDSTDVTDTANISIESAYNGTLFTVNGNGTLTAVNDENASDWARVDAIYNSSTGCTNAIVSQPSVKNIELVPGIWRLNALMGDSTIFFILLATLAAVAMTRFTSAFGGIAVAQVVMTVGWLAGYVAWAFAAASLFIGLFIGLNLAANIDYSVGRFKP